MHVAELWRYPVKSMGGEPLERAELGIGGIGGDRGIVVVRGQRIVTARSRPKLLRHRGVVRDGEVFVDGEQWDSAVVERWVGEDAGEGARLIRFDEPERFDVLPLLVATDGAVAAIGADRRRFRPNIVIGGVEGLAERSWEGKRVRIGSAVIYARDLRQRCVMTTYDPDTLEQDIGILHRIVREFDGSFALNSSVVEPAVVRLGDPVTILDG